MIELGLLKTQRSVEVESELGLSRPRSNEPVGLPWRRRLAHFGANGDIDLAFIQLGIVLCITLFALAGTEFRSDPSPSLVAPTDWHWAALLSLSEAIYLTFGLSTLARKRELEELAREAWRVRHSDQTASEAIAVRVKLLLQSLESLLEPPTPTAARQRETYGQSAASSRREAFRQNALKGRGKGMGTAFILTALGLTGLALVWLKGTKSPKTGHESTSNNHEPGW